MLSKAAPRITAPHSCSRKLFAKLFPKAVSETCFPKVPEACARAASPKPQSWFPKMLPKNFPKRFLKITTKNSSKQVFLKAIPESCPKFSQSCSPKLLPKVVPQSCCPKLLPPKLRFFPEGLPKTILPKRFPALRKCL